MKKKENVVDTIELIAEELLEDEAVLCPKRHGLLKFTLIALLAVGVVLPIYKSVNNLQNIELVEDSDVVTLASAPIAATNVKKGLITIPSGHVNQNPFLPYRDLSSDSVEDDVPNFDLVEPPDSLNANSEAARIMNTVVSGILYDKYSASAILNIEGNDYLVRKGDVVNNYHVVNILQDSVTVKLGENVYQAGIGEILTEGALYHNEVSNLNEKFGGERK